jgi:hypothetical protein
VVDGHPVAVLGQLGQRLGFLEHPLGIALAKALLMQYLDGPEDLHLHVQGFPDLTEGAAAEAFQELEAVEPWLGWGRHEFPPVGG